MHEFLLADITNYPDSRAYSITDVIATKLKVASLFKSCGAYSQDSSKNPIPLQASRASHFSLFSRSQRRPALSGSGQHLLVWASVPYVLLRLSLTCLPLMKACGHSPGSSKITLPLQVLQGSLLLSEATCSQVWWLR